MQKYTLFIILLLLITISFSIFLLKAMNSYFQYFLTEHIELTEVKGTSVDAEWLHGPSTLKSVSHYTKPPLESLHPVPFISARSASLNSLPMRHQT